MNEDKPEKHLLDLVTGKKKTSQQELFEVVSGKKKREKEQIVSDALMSVLPKKRDELVNELADEIEKVGKEISVKKASALGLSLVNILNKPNPEATEEEIEHEEKEERRELTRINQLSFREIAKEIVDEIISLENENYNKIYSLAIGLLYKFIKDDIKRALLRELDQLEGRVHFYKAEFAFGGGGDGGDSDRCREFEEEIERLLEIIEELLNRPCGFKTWGDFCGDSYTWGSFA
jgi:hypothetical protein